MSKFWHRVIRGLLLAIIGLCAPTSVAREIGLAVGRLVSTAPLIFLFTNPEGVGPNLGLLSLIYPAHVYLLMGRRSPLAFRKWLR